MAKDVISSLPSDEEIAEISIVVSGRSPNQAFFLENRLWGMPLKCLRDLFQAQDISLPTEYKFMTNAKNVVSVPAEEKISLRKLICTGHQHNEDQEFSRSRSRTHVTDSQTKEINELPASDSNIVTDFNCPPSIYIFPVRPKRKKSRPRSSSVASVDDYVDENEGSPIEGVSPTKEANAHAPTKSQSSVNSVQEGNNRPAQENSRAAPEGACIFQTCPVQFLRNRISSENNNAGTCPIQTYLKFFMKVLFALFLTMFIVTLMCFGMLYSIYLLTPVNFLGNLRADVNSQGLDSKDASLKHALLGLKMTLGKMEDTPSHPGFPEEEFNTMKKQMSNVNKRIEEISTEKSFGLSVKDLNPVKQQIIDINKRVDEISAEKRHSLSAEEFTTMKQQMVKVNEKIEELSTDKSNALLTDDFKAMKQQMAKLNRKIEEIYAEKSKAVSSDEFYAMKKQLMYVNTRLKEISAEKNHGLSADEFHALKQQMMVVNRKIEEISSEKGLSTTEFKAMKQQILNVNKRIEEISTEKSKALSADDFNVMKQQILNVNKKIEKMYADKDQAFSTDELKAVKQQMLSLDRRIKEISAEKNQGLSVQEFNIMKQKMLDVNKRVEEISAQKTDDPKCEELKETSAEAKANEALHPKPKMKCRKRRAERAEHP